MISREVRAWAWVAGAVVMSGVVVAVGCGDESSSGGSDASTSEGTSQGGAQVASGNAGSDVSSPTASGAGGASTTSSSSSTTTAASQGPGPVAVAVSASSGGGGGGAPPECDPPAAPGSIYERSAVDYLSFETVSMCKYRGEVQLIVNIAAL